METSELWDYAEKLRGTNSRNRRRDIVAQLILESEEQDIEYALNLLSGNPIHEPEQNLGVGKKTTRKAIERAFGVGYDKIRDVEKEIGNLSNVPNHLDRSEGLVERDVLTIEDITNLLYEVANTPSEVSKIKLMSNNIARAENPHIVVFGILAEKRDYPVGVTWKTIRDAVEKLDFASADEFQRAHGLSPNVGDLAVQAVNENLTLSVRPFQQISPMLASSGDVSKSGEWIAQPKYDGGRLLIHQKDGELKATTRNRRDISDNLPELKDVDWPETNFVVDTEAVGRSIETGEIVPFQKFMERFQREKKVEEKAKEIGIDFKVFDILHWRDTDVTTLSWENRNHILQENFSSTSVPNYQDMDKAYKKALNDGHEGIIAKSKSHEYIFDRSNDWVKQKPTLEPVDLVVTNAIEGTGRANGMLGAIEVSTSDDTAMGKVGTGFDDSTCQRLWERHLEGDLVGSVVEIEFEELQENDGHFGLRFPRFLRERPEGEADTIERIKDVAK